MAFLSLLNRSRYESVHLGFCGSTNPRSFNNVHRKTWQRVTIYRYARTRTIHVKNKNFRKVSLTIPSIIRVTLEVIFTETWRPEMVCSGFTYENINHCDSKLMVYYAVMLYLCLIYNH